MIVRFAQRARLDLLDIEAWIAGDSPGAAEAVIDRLVAAARGLKDMPLRFSLDERLGLRRRPIGSYLIFYRVADHIEVVRILHGSRDLGTLLEDPE